MWRETKFAIKSSNARLVDRGNHWIFGWVLRLHSLSFCLRGNTSLIGHQTPPAVKTEILERDVSKGASKHDGDRWTDWESGGEGEKQQQ